MTFSAMTRGMRPFLLMSLLLVLALAVPAAWADTGGAGPRATVDRLDEELNRELAQAPASAPDVSDDVLAEAKRFYRGLERASGVSGLQSRDGRLGTWPKVSGLKSRDTKGVPAGKLLKAALKFKGVPYVWGGASKKGVDCSGLVVEAAAKLGRRLPHSAALIYQHGTPVPKDQLQPGDLVFFANTYKPGISHVGIYAGDSEFLEASSAHGKVTFGDLNSAYFQRKYAGAKRLSGLARMARNAVSFVRGEGRKLWAAIGWGTPRT